jgi:hypothetical protein
MVVAGPHGDPDRIQPAPLGLILTQVRRDERKRNPGTGDAGASQLATHVRGEVAQPYRRYHDLIHMTTMGWAIRFLDTEAETTNSAILFW